MQGSVLRPFIIPSVHFGGFSILENELIGYSDDRTLMAVALSPSIRVTSSRVPDPSPWQG